VDARVVVITDRKLCADVPARLQAILRAVPHGSVAVQVREKDLDGAPLLAFVRAVQAVARPEDAQVWINDRLDVALAAHADGIHVPETGLPIADARRGLPIGCSRHSADAVLTAARDGADLVQLGPIFATPGKGDPLGPDALRVRDRLSPSVRLVAVGGIDSVERAREAVTAGADAVAVIRAAWTLDPGLVAAMVDAIEHAKPRGAKSWLP
jgi:thiamine-phosphate pyrophosphorylase